MAFPCTQRFPALNIAELLLLITKQIFSVMHLYEYQRFGFLFLVWGGGCGLGFFLQGTICL